MHGFVVCRVVHDDANVWSSERSFGAVVNLSRVAEDFLNESGLGIP